MKKLLIPILLFALASCQKPADDLKMNASFVIEPVVTDTFVCGIVDGGGRTLKYNDKIFRTLCKGTILRNWIIDCPLTKQFFDTAITLENCKTYGDRFSTAWYGVSASNADNWWNLQKSINTCMDNNDLPCYTPRMGNIYYSKQLEISRLVGKSYQQVSLHFFGDATMWDRDNGTTFIYTGTTGSGLNLQVGKGIELDHFQIYGQFKAPNEVDSIYLNHTAATFNDVSGKNIGEKYYGISIDGNVPPDGSTSGSTGTHIHEVTIGNFTQLLAMSPNGITANNDIVKVENLHLRSGKYGVVGTQAQEKDMRFDGIYSWDNIYCILSIGKFGKQQAGTYTIDGGNIAGRPVSLVDLSLGHWYSTHISNLTAEGLGRIGSISTQIPVVFDNCRINLSFWIPKTRTVLTSNSTFVHFNYCTIRYYDGIGGNIYVQGIATFNTCYIAGGQIIFR